MKNNHISKQKESIFKNGIIQKCYYFIFFLFFTFFQVQPAAADPPQIGSIADQTTLEDRSTSIISFTATDAETAASI